MANTIDDLEALRAKAVEDTKGGKKGNSSEMQKEIDQIDQQLDSLKKQQQDVMDNFHSQLGIFSLPPGAKDVAQAIQGIAEELKKAADAGASTAEQIQYLNAAMDELKTKTAGGLRTDQEDTLNMMKQTLDLEKQRQQVISDEADAELNIRRGLGLARALTPEQEAALQIKKLQQQRDDQLQQIDEQQATLKADLDGRMQLFGWTQKGIGRCGRQERDCRTAARHRKGHHGGDDCANQGDRGTCWTRWRRGKIPTLPAGILPSGYTLPSGGTYSPPTIQTANITINVGATANAAQIADALKKAIADINKSRTYGMQ